MIHNNFYSSSSNETNKTINFQQDGGFFRCEMGKQWLNLCFQIFTYSTERIADRLGPKATAHQWMNQSRSVQDWNNLYISRWMEAVVMTKFKNAALFWRKGKESPLLIEYIHVTFESTPGTISAQIPPLKDFLFCGFSVFLRRVVEICAARSKNESSDSEKFTQSVLNYVRTYGHDVASESVRTAFSHVVNPCIRIDSRPSHESISMIMNLRNDKMDETDEMPYESSIQIQRERRHREHKEARDHNDRTNHTNNAQKTQREKHRESHSSHHQKERKERKDRKESKTERSLRDRESKAHKPSEQHHSQLSRGEKRRVDEFMKGATKRSSDASKISHSEKDEL